VSGTIWAPVGFALGAFLVGSGLSQSVSECVREHGKPCTIHQTWTGVTVLPTDLAPHPQPRERKGETVKRRSFFGLMGGAAVAGPSMAKAAVAQGMETMSLGNALGLVGSTGDGKVAYANQAYYDGPEEISPHDPKHWVQRQLADFLGKSAEDLVEERLGTQVHQLDPDLAVNRSFSLSAKIRIQRDRNFERNRSEHKKYLMRDIRDAVKRWTERKF
jgi:hypothetical protein